MSTLEEIAQRYNAYEITDNSEFRRKARVLQSMWRSEQGYPVVKYRGRMLGSRLDMPRAQDELLNYHTPNIRQVVRDEVLDKKKSKGKMYARPRIFDDLLSSQPLCFNLFGELQYNLNLTTLVFADLIPGRVGKVTGLEFEYSPGRREPKYTGDRTAFDVYVTFETPRCGKGFVGIEVKYHENLQGQPSRHYARYDEIARLMNCFRQEAIGQLQQEPLQQLWRNHLLAGILHEAGGFEDGIFALLYPKDNPHCTQAVGRYRECLANSLTFEDWTLEKFTTIVKKHTTETWIEDFTNRYLNFSKLGCV